MRFRWLVLVAIGALVPLSFVVAPYPRELVLQHIPTVVGLVAFAFITFRGTPSPLSFACVVAFFLLHILGARWIYSYVPYDEWATALTGESLSQRLGWQRNHYDRLVHFASGVLGVPPAAEALQRLGNMRPLGAAIMGIASVLAIGAMYEMVEWQIAVRLSPEQAAAYNGQQGDIWDAQKDLALAWLGSLIAACFVFRRDFRSS